MNGIFSQFIRAAAEPRLEHRILLGPPNNLKSPTCTKPAQGQRYLFER